MDMTPPSDDAAVCAICDNIDSYLYYPEAAVRAFRFLVDHPVAALHHFDRIISVIPRVEIFGMKYPERFDSCIKSINPFVEEGVVRLWDQKKEIAPALFEIMPRMSEIANSFVQSQLAVLPDLFFLSVSSYPRLISVLPNVLEDVLRTVFNFDLSIPDMILGYTAEHMDTWFHSKEVSPSSGSGAEPSSFVPEHVDIDLADLVPGGA